MATGSLWNLDNPLKPWALFDTNAILEIPFELEDWLASLGAGYDSHELIAPAPLEGVNDDYSSVDGGIIAITIKVAAGAEFVKGKKYPFTVHLVCDDGQEDERTLWLKLVDR